MKCLSEMAVRSISHGALGDTWKGQLEDEHVMIDFIRVVFCGWTNSDLDNLEGIPADNVERADHEGSNAGFGTGNRTLVVGKFRQKVLCLWTWISTRRTASGISPLRKGAWCLATMFIFRQRKCGALTAGWTKPRKLGLPKLACAEEGTQCGIAAIGIEKWS